ncbi:hypothetical protein C10C_0512 [Chlamydia serpentis]|uniref:Uncharacterized protein n=1 Tax=Chlamydia serpentis TaxID=1967782 RepID=A0A2R8FB58_9CHLA|nr:hypothetical protein [Chlamydia serpentis]SPN73673.1 hypothetical protein C10C_0512 [Chlamydia serpentis]
MTLPVTEQSNTKWQLESEVFASSRSLAMIGTVLVFFVIALVLSGLSLLPQVVLPFSGAYFIIGSFLVLISLGLLLINCFCEFRHYISLI